MCKKIFLTSFIAIGFVMPAMAEPSNSGSFPQNGLMQEDYTYTNAATSTNMDGVYEGTVNATAQYENVLYQLLAGQYLPANSETPIACDQPGYFCPGDQNGVYYGNTNQGLTSCSTVGDGSYTLSDGTGSTNASCYKTCSASCTNPTAPAHSTNVSYGQETASGEQYYGSSCNASAPTCSISFDCVNGYHKRPDLTQSQARDLYRQILQMQGEDPEQIPVSYIDEQVTEAFDYWEQTYSSLNGTNQMLMLLLVDIAQHGASSMDQVFLSAIGSGGSAGIQYSKNLNGVEKCVSGNETVSCETLSSQYQQFASFRANAQNGDWFIFIPNTDILVAGHTRCIDDQYSPCQYSYSNYMGQTVNTEYVAGGGDWFDGWNFKHNSETGDGATCQDVCSSEVADNAEADFLFFYMHKKGLIDLSGGSFVTTMEATGAFASVRSAYVDYVCDTNRITINWDGAEQSDIDANNAAWVKFTGDIRTPRAAIQLPGKRFTGWRFSAPSGN